jgi:prepilin-type N-terminal cleavage/methylation domain-containing protein
MQSKAIQGHSLAELLFVIAIIAILLAFGLPHVKAYTNRAELVGASDVFQGEFRKARSMAISSGMQTAIVFEGQGDDSTFALYRDGNHNGVLRADIRAGRDTLISGPFPVRGNTQGVHVAIHPGIPAIPPESGTLDPDDPIRFGNSNMVSFSALGTATPGTFYLASGAGRLQAGVRVTGGSSRVRIMIYEGGRWSQR